MAKGNFVDVIKVRILRSGMILYYLGGPNAIKGALNGCKREM